MKTSQSEHDDVHVGITNKTKANPNHRDIYQPNQVLMGNPPRLGALAKWYETTGKATKGQLPSNPPRGLEGTQRTSHTFNLKSDRRPVTHQRTDRRQSRNDLDKKGEMTGHKLARRPTPQISPQTKSNDWNKKKKRRRKESKQLERKKGHMTI